MIRKYLESHGMTLPRAEWYGRMAVFLDWYQGYVQAFHRYWVFNGVHRLARDRFTLGMAKTVCEEHASLLLNEKVRISCEGFGALPDLLDRCDFYQQGNRLVELTMALGTGAFVETLDGQGMPRIDYIRGDMIFPLTWDGWRVTECAFGSRVMMGSGLGWYIQLHKRGPQGYVIRNVWLDEQGREQPAPDGVAAEVATGSPVPLFQLFRPAMVNSIDLDCPMGISVFGMAIDQLKAVDLVYDSYVNEFQLGRKRIMVPQSMATMMMQQDGTTQSRFDPNDTVFYVYEQSQDGKQDLKETNMTLRTAEHESGLQRQIDLLSKKCGLGVGRFRFDGGQVKTATEVISQQSDLYQSIKRNEKALESAIFDMVRALSFLSGGSPEVMPVIAFDDSIIEDAGATIDRNVMLVNAGLRSKVAAIMEIDQCDEETAKAKLAAITAESAVGAPEVDTAFMGE